MNSSRSSGIALPIDVKSWQAVNYLEACKKCERGADSDRGIQELEEDLRKRESAVPYLGGLKSLAKALEYELKLALKDSRQR